MEKDYKVLANQYNTKDYKSLADQYNNQNTDNIETPVDAGTDSWGKTFLKNALQMGTMDLGDELAGAIHSPSGAATAIGNLFRSEQDQQAAPEYYDYKKQFLDSLEAGKEAHPSARWLGAAAGLIPAAVSGGIIGKGLGAVGGALVPEAVTGALATGAESASPLISNASGLAKFLGKSIPTGAAFGAIQGAGEAERGNVGEGAIQGAKLGAVAGPVIEGLGKGAVGLHEGLKDTSAIYNNAIKAFQYETEGKPVIGKDVASDLVKDITGDVANAAESAQTFQNENFNNPLNKIRSEAGPLDISEARDKALQDAKDNLSFRETSKSGIQNIAKSTQANQELNEINLVLRKYGILNPDIDIKNLDASKQAELLQDLNNLKKFGDNPLSPEAQEAIEPLNKLVRSNFAKNAEYEPLMKQSSEHLKAMEGLGLLNTKDLSSSEMSDLINKIAKAQTTAEKESISGLFAGNRKEEIIKQLESSGDFETANKLKSLANDKIDRLLMASTYNSTEAPLTKHLLEKAAGFTGKILHKTGASELHSILSNLDNRAAKYASAQLRASGRPGSASGAKMLDMLAETHDEGKRRAIINIIQNSSTLRQVVGGVTGVGNGNENQ